MSKIWEDEMQPFGLGKRDDSLLGVTRWWLSHSKFPEIFFKYLSANSDSHMFDHLFPCSRHVL